MRWKRVLVALLVVATVLGSLPAPILAQAADNPGNGNGNGPPEFAGVPDGNVQTDLPPQARGKVNANVSEWRGNVMTSTGASTLGVTITTKSAALGGTENNGPGAQSVGAQSQSLSQSEQQSDPTFALELTDDDIPDGREIAIPRKLLVDALGYRPAVATIRHEDGGQVTAELRKRGNMLVFDVPHFSTNTVTFSGEVSLSGEPASDGAQYTYDVQNLDAVQNYSIDVTGRTTYDHETVDGTIGGGDTLPLDLAGNAPLTGPPGMSTPQVSVTGVESTTAESKTFSGVNAGDSTVANVDGNQPPTDAELTFHGSESTTAESTSATALTNGDSHSYEVGGNVPAEDVGVTFTGRETTASASGSGTGSGSVSVGGNLDATGESVTFTGSVSSERNDKSASGVGLSSSQPLNIGGNMQPVAPSGGDPVLEVTGNVPTVDYNPVDDEGTGSTDGYAPLVGDDADDLIHSEVQIEPDATGTAQSATVNITHVEDFPSSYSPTVDVYLSSGGPDQTVREGTKVASWTPSAETGEQTISFSTTPTVEAGQTYSLEFMTNSHESDGDNALHDWLGIGTSSDGNGWMVHNASSGYSTEGYADVDLSIDQDSVSDVSVTDGQGNSASFGTLTDGETVSRTINLQTSSSELSWSGTGTAGIDYTLKKVERTGTEDPEIDVDGDESAEASYSGVLTSDESSGSISLDGLSPGSNSISTTTAAGPQPEWSLDWTEVTATENPALDLNGDGTDDVSYSGILTSGEQETVSAGSTLPSGSQTAVLSATAGEADVAIDWSAITATKDPTLDVGNDGTINADYVGTLRDGESTTVSVNGLALDGNTLAWDSAADGGEFEANLSWTEVAHTENPALDVDNDGTYEHTFTGVLSPGSTQTFDATALTRSSSGVTLSTSNASDAEVGADYREVTKTETPAIEVNGQIAGGATVGVLDDGETQSLATDTSWVRDGTNRVNVSLPDLSSDAPAMAVGLDYSHDAVDEQDVSYAGERWSERYNVSRTWAGDQTNATVTIPFSGTVVGMRALEIRRDGGEWSALSDSEYSLDGTTLTAHLGSVSAGETVDVRANGSKVRVTNGTIQVLNPTQTGTTLNTRIELVEWGAGASIQLREPGRDLIAYTYNESWTGANSRMRALSTGERYLTLPNAEAGSRTRVATLPVEVSPQTGDVAVSVSEASNAEPRFTVRPGQASGDIVDYTFLEAQDGREYLLYSESEGITRDSGTAESPLTLTDDDSSETLQFQLNDGDSGGGDSGGSSGSGGWGNQVPQVTQPDSDPFGLVMLVGVILALLVGVYYWTRSSSAGAGTASGVLSFLSDPYVMAGLAGLAALVAMSADIIIVPAAVWAIVVLLAALAGLYGGLRSIGWFQWPAFLLLVTSAVLMAMVFGAPNLLDAIIQAPQFQRFIPLLVGGVLYLAYRAIQTYRRGQVTQVIVDGQRVDGGSD